jgi:hypothetical protein
MFTLKFGVLVQEIFQIVPEHRIVFDDPDGGNVDIFFSF